MNFIDRFVSALSPEAGLRRLKAREALTELRYEGATTTRDRSLTPFHTTAVPESWSAHRDRLQLMSEARDLVENFPMVKGILRMLTTYCFGELRYQSRTGNRKVDNANEEAWAEFAKNCDLGGRFTFDQIVRLLFLSFLRDGDVGLALRLEESKLQIIEADRIGKPYEGSEPDYYSGIFVDPKTGRPLRYRIYERTKEGNYVNPIPVEAGRFIHVFDPTRADQYRGITILDAAIPTCRDIYDIFKYEKFAVKWMAGNTAIAQRDGGEPDPWKSGSPAVGNNRIEHLEYGRINYMGEGESLKAFESQRPNASFGEFIEKLEKQVCHCLQLPYGFYLNPSDVGGVVARLESQKALRVCRYYQNLITTLVLDPVKNAFLAQQIVGGKLTGDPRFRLGRWQFPAWPTADIGHESQANIEEFKMGLKTAADIYAEQGKDWEEEFEQIGREQTTLDTLAKELGLSPDRLSQRNPNPTAEPPPEGGGGGAPPEPKKPAKAKPRSQKTVLKELAENLTELFDPNQPRYAAGSSIGGKWRPMMGADKAIGGGGGDFVRSNMQSAAESLKRKQEAWQKAAAKHGEKYADDVFPGGRPDTKAGKKEKPPVKTVPFKDMPKGAAPVGKLPTIALPHTVEDSKRGIIRLARDPDVIHRVLIEKSREQVLDENGKPKFTPDGIPITTVQRTFADGSKIPEWAERISPGKTNVTISINPDDPKAKWHHTAVSFPKLVEGRVVRMDIQTDQRVKASSGEKFSRVKELRTRVAKIMEQVAKDADQEDDEWKQEEALITQLMYQTGARPGSIASASRVESKKSFIERMKKKGKVDKDGNPLPLAYAKYDGPTYGAYTLLGRHISSVKGGKEAVLTYESGKHKGATIEQRVTGELALTLLERKRNVAPDERIWASAPEDVDEYIANIGIGKPKDIRTVVANQHAEKVAKSYGRKHRFASKKEYDAARTAVGTAASDIIGNQPSMALKSYVDPELMDGWTYPEPKPKPKKKK